MKPFRTGLALSITVGLFYAVCTLVWAQAPGPFLGFMNNLFHGMDFTPMVKPRPFAWQGFVAALVILSAWALLMGAFFAALLNRLSR